MCNLVDAKQIHIASHNEPASLNYDTFFPVIYYVVGKRESPTTATNGAGTQAAAHAKMVSLMYCIRNTAIRGALCYHSLIV